MGILGEILRGGAEKVIEAGAITAGGHSIDDKEPKYGLSVTGTVHPDRVLANKGARAGDILILTKPIGSGVINTAVKGEIASPAHIDEAVKTMITLNKYAAEKAVKYSINACTDITGFGLAGHAYEMAAASNVSIHIKSKNLIFIDGAEEYAQMGLIPAGTYRNKKYLGDKYLASGIKEYLVDLIFDPQTSGGLLYSMKEDEGMSLFKELTEMGIECSIAGYVTELKEKSIYIE